MITLERLLIDVVGFGHICEANLVSSTHVCFMFHGPGRWMTVGSFEHSPGGRALAQRMGWVMIRTVLLLSGSAFFSQLTNSGKYHGRGEMGGK